LLEEAETDLVPPLREMFVTEQDHLPFKPQEKWDLHGRGRDDESRRCDPHVVLET
jgi:hypothetical protein